MTLTRARKAKLRWEVIDAAFDRIEALHEEGEISEAEEAYMKQAIRRAARTLTVTDHVWL